MRIIGLTGGIASGKSTVSAFLRELGAPIIDADEISRALTAQNGPALPRIAARFGAELIDQQGRLDRRALSLRVFGDEEERQALNAILHPMVQAEMQRQIEELRLKGARIAVLDVPLLFESGMEGMAERTWLVACPMETQLSRLMARDRLSREEALLRIKSQMPLDEKKKRADLLIDSSRSLCEMREEIQRLWRNELALYENPKKHRD
ncbi:MAG: dephospho-CoA kinase [Christensenellaceae bacterium]|nr:dephospho-CoA kinase [Christensenellaceae bacterium]